MVSDPEIDQLILKMLEGRRGQQLTETQLASALVLGLVEVRESLRRLEGEGRLRRDGEFFWIEVSE
jgi:DNA-binding GntR family transcriptional regulator